MQSVLVSGLILIFCGCAQSPALVHDRPVQYWVQALRNRDPLARKRAVEALGNVGIADPDVLPGLIGAVKDGDVRVRSAAILALLRIGSDARDALPALAEACKDKNKTVQHYAARAVERISGEQ